MNGNSPFCLLVLQGGTALTIATAASHDALAILLHDAGAHG